MIRIFHYIILQFLFRELYLLCAAAECPITAAFIRADGGVRGFQQLIVRGEDIEGSGLRGEGKIILQRRISDGFHLVGAAERLRGSQKFFFRVSQKAEGSGSAEEQSQS